MEATLVLLEKSWVQLNAFHFHGCLCNNIWGSILAEGEGNVSLFLYTYTLHRKQTHSFYLELYRWQCWHLLFLWLKKQSAGFVQRTWINVYCCYILGSKLLFNNSTICGYWACCLVSRKICWNVFLHGLFICTGLQLLQVNSSGTYLIGKLVMLLTQVIF